MTTAAGRAALAPPLPLLLLQAVRGSRRMRRRWPGCKPQSEAPAAPAAARGEGAAATTTPAAVAAQMRGMMTAASWVSDRGCRLALGLSVWGGSGEGERHGRLTQTLRAFFGHHSFVLTVCDGRWCGRQSLIN